MAAAGVGASSDAAATPPHASAVSRPAAPKKMPGRGADAPTPTEADDDHRRAADDRSATVRAQSDDEPLALNPEAASSSSSEKKRKRKKRAAAATAFACGLSAGIVQAGLFNPYDRALYLSVKHSRPFLAGPNWSNPYLGFAQSVGGRALSGGLFFPLEATFRSAVEAAAAADAAADRNADRTAESPPSRRAFSPDLSNFLVGSLAGSVNALLLNPLSAIKYRTWGRCENRGVIKEALVMWGKAGVAPFFHGFFPTVLRDVAFGGTYTLIRMHLRKRDGGRTPAEGGDSGEERERRRKPHERQWLWNVAAAAAATVVSGPFNLARNVQFAAAAAEPRPSTAAVLRRLWGDAAAAPGGAGGSARHLQRRLRIGWGTARVAAGMAFGQALFDALLAVASSREG